MQNHSPTDFRRCLIEFHMFSIFVDRDGDTNPKIYQNHNNKYIYSDNILDIGFKDAIKQTGFDYNKFINRGGNYNL